METISWNALAGVIALATFVFTSWRWLVGTLRASEAEQTAARAKLREDLDGEIRRVHQRISDLKDMVQAFELEVARNYATAERLSIMEGKLTGALDKLIARVDAMASDIHRWVGRVEAERDKHT